MRVKRILFVLLTFLAMVIVVEGLAFLGVSRLQKRWMSYRNILALQADRMEAPGLGFDIDREDVRPHPTVGRNVVVHPYVGFVPSPAFVYDSSPQGTAAAYGFPGNPHGIFHQRSGETLIVALLGGSVAWGFPTSCQNLLGDLLTGSNRFQGREFVFLNLAYPGYKQPQQLMILNYLLVLGAELDIVLNLDGFNEITLPVNENMHRGVFPFFPRAWFFRVAKLNPQTRLGVGELAYLESMRRSVAALHSGVPFRYSMTSGFIWAVRDHLLSNRIAKRRAQLMRKPEQEGDYVATGPPVYYENEMATFLDLARTWKRSSTEMNYLCAGHAMEYYHCLQPTLHVPRSKPLSKHEQELEREFPNPNKRCARKAYPLLISMGRELADEGVAFLDLTRVFQHTGETIYHDSCHLNGQGYQMVAECMADFILAH